MCTQYINIKSNSKRYRPLVSRAFLNVPCGRCPECTQSQQDDWFLRTWQECKSYNESGGKVVFFSPTYSNTFLPVFTDSIEYIDIDTGEVYTKTFSVPCFNKKHKDVFMNSLLKYFERLGVTGKNSKGIRYIWCSEYGESENSTHRPHYHVLLFLPKECVDMIPHKQFLKDLLQRFWKYGMIRWSKEVDGGIFVQSAFAAKYVTKYVLKDLAYYDQPELHDYLYDEDDKLIHERWLNFKDFAPKHWQSKSFGLDLVDYCKDDNVFKDGLDFKFVNDLSLAKRKIYKVPRYIERKLLYMQDMYGSLVLNSRGLKVKRDILSFDEKVKNQVVKLEEIFSEDGLKKFLHNADYCKLDNLRSYLHGHSLRYYAAYQISMVGTLFDIDDPMSERVKVMSEDKFIDFCRKVYNLRQEGYYADDFYSELGFLDDKNCPKFKNIDDFSVFSSFNQLNLLLLQLKHERSMACHNDYLKKKQIIKRMKLKVS